MVKAAALFVACLAGIAFGLHLAPMPTFEPPRQWMPAAVHERPLDLLSLTVPIGTCR